MLGEEDCTDNDSLKENFVIKTEIEIKEEFPFEACTIDLSKRTETSSNFPETPIEFVEIKTEKNDNNDFPDRRIQADIVRGVPNDSNDSVFEIIECEDMKIEELSEDDESRNTAKKPHSSWNNVREKGRRSNNKALEKKKLLRKTKVNSNVFKCKKCKFFFESKPDLTRHSETHKVNWTHYLELPPTTNLYPFGCELCKKVFTRKHRLECHMYFHLGTKPYHCDICNTFFRHKPSLFKHLRMHKGDTNYTCGVCNKSFVYTSELAAHMAKHKSDKEYLCHICHKDFVHPSSLKRHVSLHDKSQKFSCDECGKSFKLKQYVMDHKRYFHKNLPKTKKKSVEAFSESES